tara:strand:+ start:130 stop:393 length:264 start_codon:yes stop_codon:yes gene_type:complete
MLKTFFIRLFAVLILLAILIFLGWWQKDRVIVFLDKHFYEESQRVCIYVLGRISEDSEPIMLDGFCHIGQLALVSEAKTRLQDDSKP